MTEQTATETKIGKTVFFIGKNEYWHRFEIVGENLVKVESFWFDDIQKTETYSKIAARKIWKMLLSEGYADETSGKKNYPAAEKPAEQKPEFSPLTGTPNPVSDRDAEIERRVVERNAARVAAIHAAGRIECPKCGGTGKLNGLSKFRCWDCRGQGSVPNDIRQPVRR